MEQKPALILLDTNIFVIDEIFTHDENYQENRVFLDSAAAKATTVYNVLEFCGIVATSTQEIELEKFFKAFHTDRGVVILYPKLYGDYLLFSVFIEQVLEHMQRGMRYGDAKILTVAEESDVTTIVTWNKRRFEGKTHIPVKTPSEFLNISQ
ncbi:MAG: type II toxin-antitoxin system VapC family toxin [Candidatus Heimdallarchaeota archaeon]